MDDHEPAEDASSPAPGHAPAQADSASPPEARPSLPPPTPVWWSATWPLLLVAVAVAVLTVQTDPLVALTLLVVAAGAAMSSLPTWSRAAPLVAFTMTWALGIGFELVRGNAARALAAPPLATVATWAARERALERAHARGGNRTTISHSPQGTPAGWSA